MSDRPDPDEPQSEGVPSDELQPEEPQPDEPEWVRRQRLEAIFGNSVDGRGLHHGGGKGDAWYRDQTPPHHG